MQTITPIHNKNILTPDTDSSKDNYIELSNKYNKSSASAEVADRNVTWYVL